MEYQLDDTETVASAVLHAVSAFEDSPIESLPPLQETVPTEAINRLFQDRFESSPALLFKYSNSYITIWGDKISISSNPPETQN